MAVSAEFDNASGRLTFHATSQNPAGFQGTLAKLLGLGGPYGPGDTWHPAWVRNGPHGPELLYGGVACPARAA